MPDGKLHVVHVGRYIRPPWVEGVANVARELSEISTESLRSSLVSVVHADFPDLPFAENVRYVPSLLRERSERARLHAVIARMDDVRVVRGIVRALKEMERQDRVDLVHIHNVSHLALASAIRSIRWRRRPRIVFHHYGASGSRSTALDNAGRRWSKRMADAHFCSSQLSVNELKAAGEVEGRIYFVPPTIDGYAPEPTVDAAAPRVSYLGNLTEERFPLSTLKRVIEIIEERKGIFELVTSTRAVNDAHVAAVEGLQSESVRIVRRNLSREEKQALFARTNIFLLPFSTPSAIDPPVTLLEAMGAGNLVVATDVQGVQYVVDDGRTGFVVEPNANAVASGLRRALDSLPNAQMRGDARSSVRARFERLRVIESATRAYESIISEAKP